jgi:hypothetical protein
MERQPPALFHLFYPQDQPTKKTACAWRCRPGQMPVDGRNLVSQLRSALRSLIVIAVIAVVTAAVFRNLTLALVVTAGLLVHELGHILAASYYGVHWELILNPLGIGTLTPLDQRRALTQFQNAVIHLAGPAASLLLALVALLLGGVLVRAVPDSPWMQLANFSALMAVLNVLPFAGVSDGGRYLQRLFASLPARLEPPLVIGILLGLLSSAWALAVTGLHPGGLLALLLIGLWLVVHMLFEAGRDNTQAALNTLAMSVWQSLGSLTVMLVVLLLSTWFVLITPFWLTTADLLEITLAHREMGAFLAQQGRLVLSVLMILGLLLALQRFSLRRS